MAQNCGTERQRDSGGQRRQWIGAEKRRERGVDCCTCSTVVPLLPRDPRPRRLNETMGLTGSRETREWGKATLNAMQVNNFAGCTSRGLTRLMAQLQELQELHGAQGGCTAALVDGCRINEKQRRCKPAY
jgi:hypothetical protein